MAIDLEVKHILRGINARLEALEKTQGEMRGQLDVQMMANLAPKLEEVTKQIEAAQPKVKLCPHCGEKPAYFFHVRSCAKKEKLKDGDDRNRDPRSPQ
jgi:hypothetical protein